MKRVLLALICCGMLAAPALAQDDDLESKSTQELHDELHRLMKKASEEMEGLEKELARTSLESSKPDIIAERIKRVRDMMEKGELDELPEGLQEYLKEHPEQAAELSGKSVEEFRKLAEDSGALEKLLRKNPDLLKKLAENESAIEDVLKRQVAIEKRLEETLKRTEETAEKAKEDIDKSLEVAHIIKSRSC